MPASASQPMTLAAYPVAASAADLAHSAVAAVTITRQPVIGKASAKVSSSGMLLMATTLTLSPRRSGTPPLLLTYPALPPTATGEPPSPLPCPSRYHPVGTFLRPLRESGLMDILEDAFLATIREHPYDDAPRLIFADWLEDHGDPDRATFIRLQVDRARCKPHDLRQRKLLALEEPLLHEHEHRWRETLPHLDGVTWEDFSRGFVEGVFVPDVDTLLRHSA
ncbi:MAG: TIGR02996 domain-containing protein, partial [Gemmataceae bacterium]